MRDLRKPLTVSTVPLDADSIPGVEFKLIARDDRRTGTDVQTELGATVAKTERDKISAAIF